MAEVVVDQLEPVEVEEQDRGELSPARGALERLLEPVHEQHPVRQPGQLVVERPLHQLRLEGLVPADVAGVQDDPAHPGLVEQVGPLHLEPSPRAVAVLPAQLDRPRPAPLLEQLGVEGLRALRVPLVDERPPAGPDQPVRLVAEHALDGGAHVPDRAVGLEHQDHVGSVLHEGAEALLARPEPLLLARQPAVGAPEPDDAEAEPAHGGAASPAKTTTRRGQRPVGALEHAGVHAGGEPDRLAHLFQTRARGATARAWSRRPREERERLVHGGLLRLHGGADPARGRRAALQTQEPVERDDAPLARSSPPRSSASCCRASRSRPASSAPGAGRGSPGA